MGSQPSGGWSSVMLPRLARHAPMDQPSAAGNDLDAYPLSHRLLYETACALAESATLADAAPTMLRAVCAALNWEYGALWEVDSTRTTLRCVGTWQPAGEQFAAFAAASRQTTFAQGI